VVAAGAVTAADRLTADAAEVASDPAACSAPLGPKAAAEAAGVDVEPAAGVALGELAEMAWVAADVTGLAGVELAGDEGLGDRLDDAGADCEAAGCEAGAEAEPLVELELPVEPEPSAGAVDWAGVESAEAAEPPCESVDPAGLTWDDVL
jgi:hypothetical protein